MLIVEVPPAAISLSACRIVVIIHEISWVINIVKEELSVLLFDDKVSLLQDFEKLTFVTRFHLHSKIAQEGFASKGRLESTRAFNETPLPSISDSPRHVSGRGIDNC